MPQRRNLLLAALGFVVALSLTPATPTPADAEEWTSIVGPSRIYYVDADTVFAMSAKEWLSPWVRHQEKLLRTSLRLAYWRERLPGDMRRVFDILGYPTGRVLMTPIGHTEELWYYGQLSPPLRFRDGVLVNTSRLDEILSER